MFSVDSIPDARSTFDHDAVIKLPGIIPPDLIELLRDTRERSIWTSNDNVVVGGFARSTYAPGSMRTAFEVVSEHAPLRAALRALVGEPLIFTRADRFCLTEQRGGTPWHFGRQAFCFVPPMDPGFSLWIPLDPIVRAEQAGGMTWVPESVWSARARFQMWARHALMPPEDRSRLRAELVRQFGEDGLVSWAGPYDRAFLEAHRVSDDFRVGDALFFSKFTWHRSCRFKAGPMKSRMACVMRFVSQDARLDVPLIHAASPDLDDDERRAQGVFGSFLQDIEDGDLLRSSELCPEPR